MTLSLIEPQLTAPQSDDLESSTRDLGSQEGSLPRADTHENSLPGAELIVEEQHQLGNSGPLTVPQVEPAADVYAWFNEIGFIGNDWNLPKVGAAEELLR